MPVNITLSDDEARELIRVLFHAEQTDELKFEVGDEPDYDAIFFELDDSAKRREAWDSTIHKFMTIAPKVGMASLVEEFEDRLRWRFKSDEAQEIMDCREKHLERTLLAHLGWDLAQVHMDELGIDLGDLGEGDPETNPMLGDALLLQMNLADIYQDHIKQNGLSCLIHGDDKLKSAVNAELGAYSRIEGDYVRESAES